MIKVGVVILNYKVKELALRCISSVKESNYKDLLIVVVDNNSNDGLIEELSTTKDIILIANKQNLGFTGGNNIGIKKALQLGVEYVLILNPDTTIKKDTIEILVKKIEEYDAGIVGPKIYFDQSDTIWFAGGSFDKANVLGGHLGVDQKDQGQYDTDQEVDYITGAAMLIKREVIDKIGLFDERYFLYYEDSDFCLRAKKAGFKIMYIASAVVYHKNAQSTGLGSPLQDYFITRNRMLLASKFLSFRTRFALFREAMRNLDKPVRRKAFLDFLMGKFGKGNY